MQDESKIEILNQVSRYVHNVGHMRELQREYSACRISFDKNRIKREMSELETLIDRQHNKIGRIINNLLINYQKI
jgi:hypothetical protein